MTEDSLNRPLLGFPPETFRDRRDRVVQELDGAILILPAAPISTRSRDTAYRYRPDSELFYLTGCLDPGVVAVLDGTREGGEFVLFVPERDPDAETWSGPRMGPERAPEIFGADEALPVGDLAEELPRRLEAPTRVFFRFGVHPPLDTMVLAALRRARGRGARKGDGPRAVVDPGQLLDRMRLIKGPEELVRVRRATSLTVEGFRKAMLSTRPGMGEWEVESILESAFRRGGARDPAFPTIVGSGINGCTLHYTANQDRIGEDELVLIDGGAEVDLYVGDVTRTFPSSGAFSAEQRELYEVVRRALGAAVGVVQPGAPVSSVHDAAVKELTKGLVDLGLLSGEVEELVEEGAYRPFFPHQTSHWLGLDVHDVGDFAEKGSSRHLEAGMLLTVEPGLYIGPRFGDTGTPFAGMGVRLEDDILVTDEGAENLTEALPTDPDEVAAMVGAE